MKYPYPEMVATPFNGMRFYETPEGKFYPSITTILGDTVSEEKKASLKKWQTSLGVAAAAKKTQDAADNGTAVHLLAERYLKGEELIQGETFSPLSMSSFNALKMKLNKVEPWGQEVALYTDLLEISGRCDCVGLYKGVPSIIDFKTSTKIKSEKQIDDYKLQVCAYSIMHNEMFGTDIMQGVILMTSDGGFPQEFIVDLADQIELLVLRVDEFYRRLNNKL
jgi:hypothetical protein